MSDVRQVYQLKKVTHQLQEYMTTNVQSKLIDSNISQLGGQI